MAMDVAALSATIKQVQEANTAGKSEEVIRLLRRLKEDVVATEDLLRQSRAGIAIGKLRQHATPGIAALARDIVRVWKEQVEEGKRKRKRDESEGSTAPGDVKRVKGEGSAAASPAAGSASPKKDAKDKAAAATSATDAAGKDGAVKSKSPETLVTIDTSRAKPRTAKEDGVATKLKADNTEAAGEEVRDKCVVMIYDALAIDSNASVQVLSERAIAIERECCKLMNYSTGNDYRGKIRTLFLNLKDKGNPALRNEIVLGDLLADRVVRLTKEEMASESMKAMNAKIEEQNLFNAKGAEETLAETDAFKCGKCHNRKCRYYQMQTRSADEPMTTFVTCTVCNNRWKFS